MTINNVKYMEDLVDYIDIKDDRDYINDPVIFNKSKLKILKKFIEEHDEKDKKKLMKDYYRIMKKLEDVAKHIEYIIFYVENGETEPYKKW